MIKRLFKIAAAFALAGMLAIATLLGAMRLDHNSDTALPTPTGPFRVGRTSFVWTDSSQTDAFAPQPGTKRELFVWLWYPAEPRQPSQTVDDYIPAPWRTAMEEQRSALFTKLVNRDLSHVHAHSIRDAGLSPLQNSYPVIVMPGGLDFSILAEDLASRGYVVASPEAPYRNLVVFPDGRVIPRAPQNNPEELDGPEREQLAVKLVKAGSADMSLVLDRLTQLNTSDPSGKFQGKLDLQRVGAFGHSIRGATTLQFCHDDPRCAACIDLDGIPFGSVIKEGLAQPVLFLMSDQGMGGKNPEAVQAQTNFGPMFARLPAGRRPLMIRGSNHFMFSDSSVLRSPVLMSVLRTLHIVRIDGSRQVGLAAHFIGAFFDVYLNGSPAERLNAGPEYPEIEHLP